MSEELINTILQYAPTILVVIMMVLNALGQKTNLINGLKTIATKAEEIEQSAKFAELQDKLNGLVEEQKALLAQLKELSNDINKLENRE